MIAISQIKYCTEKNLGGDITVLPSLVPGIADDIALGRVQQSGALVVGRDDGNGGGNYGLCLGLEINSHLNMLWDTGIILIALGIDCGASASESHEVEKKNNFSRHCEILRLF